MSRYINFRIWHKPTRTYMEPSAFIFYYDRGVVALDAWAGHRICRCNIEEVQIEQSTGLKDENSKEIYEGDIVKTTDRVTVKGLIFPVGVVEFKQQAFWICNVPSERPDFAHNETLLEYWETDLEVIGNIHENPELLGGEE